MNNWKFIHLRRLINCYNEMAVVHIGIKSMPTPDDILIAEGLNKLIQDKLRYDREELQVDNTKLISTFIDEQKWVYDKILNAVSRGEGGVFFYIDMAEQVKHSLGDHFLLQYIANEVLFLL